jgi:hypothetical protein
MNHTLTLTGINHAQIEIAPDAYQQRDVLLATLSPITAVSDCWDAEIATEALRLASAMVKAVEAARVEVGGPVLTLTKKINETAKTFIGQVAIEEARLKRLLGDYAAAEQRKADIARRAAQDAADKLAREAAQAARAAERATNDAQAEQAQQVAAAAEVKAVEALVAVAEIKRDTPAGTTLRKTWKHEVIDIKALYAARPDLCVIEPNGAAIRAQIPHNQSIPGLRIWQEASVSVR